MYLDLTDNCCLAAWPELCPLCLLPLTVLPISDHLPPGPLYRCCTIRPTRGHHSPGLIRSYGEGVKCLINSNGCEPNWTAPQHPDKGRQRRRQACTGWRSPGEPKRDSGWKLARPHPRLRSYPRGRRGMPIILGASAQWRAEAPRATRKRARRTGRARLPPRRGCVGWPSRGGSTGVSPSRTVPASSLIRARASVAGTPSGGAPTRARGRPSRFAYRPAWLPAPAPGPSP